MHDLALGDLGRNAGPHRALEDAPEPLGSPALPDPGQARVIGQRLVQRVAGKPTNRDVHLRFPHQPPVMDDAEQKAREHQPDGHLGIDAGPPVVQAIKIADLLTQPAQIENAIDPGKDTVIRNELTQRTGDEQLQPIALLPPQHSNPPKASVAPSESAEATFFNSPYMHFLRNALDHMPRKRDDDCLQEMA